ncbi:DUF4374 domain-containing protein [Maribellus sediminis]|uniref:DUF4374 domain-containing protein n=1 Tax=Maribellus sediminis TaxID=2696285 RepID=UPI0014314231|nr:DUF4374 domain-containing protein [Maribellus sediminis]
MKQLFKLRFLILILLFAGMSQVIISCSDEETGEDEYVGEDAFVLSLAYQGTDGNFTYYTVQFDDVMNGSLSAIGKGIDHLGYYTFNQVDNKIYATGGFELTDIIAMKKNTAGELEESGGVSSFSNSLNDVIKGEDGSLVAIEMSNSSDVVSLHRINPETVSVQDSKTTAVSNLTDLTGPSYSGMVQAGNYLFVSFYISDPATFATGYTDKAQLAVFTYPGLEFVKVIEDDRTGPIGGFGTSSGLIKDNSGNVYALSHSNPANGYSQFTKEAAILKINSGETTFDQSYLFDFNSVTGGKTTAHLVYLEGNKVFAEINMQDRSEQGAWSDSPLKPAILDLQAQTVKYIDDVPEHSGLGRKLAATSLYDNGYVYLVVPEDINSYVYRINTKDYSATKGAVVEANFTAGFFKL